MADLAKLVVRLEMQSAQLQSGLDKANAKLAGFEKTASAALTKLQKKFDRFGGGVKGALGVLIGGFSFKAIIDASAEAAENFALLQNAVANAGAAAGGRTAENFAEVSKDLQNLTTFSDDSIQSVQQLLLRFQAIRTDRFDEATARVLDLSTALRTDLDSAAKLVGRSLADPEKGITALAKAGVILSDSQKTVIKGLVDSGQRAEAQGVLLDALAKKYGGAAEAARGNFSGALKAVKNSINDLMEVDGGLPGATESLNELAKTLQDPAVREGADALFSVVVSGAAKAAKFIGELASGVGALFAVGGNRVQKLEDQLEFLKEERNSFLPFVANLGGKGDIFPEGGFDVLGPAKLDEKINAIEAELRRIQGLGLEGIETAKTVKKAVDDTAGAVQLPDIEVVDNTEALAAAAEKLQKALEGQGKALTEQLLTPLEKYDASVATADKLLAAHVITTETWARALGAARGELEGVSKGILEVSERYKTLDEQLESGALADVNEQLSKDFEDMGAEIGDLDIGLKKQEKEIGVFAEQAARNTQDILADGITSALHDGFAKGAEGALEAFGNMLEQMAIQAIAANIAGKIFGEDGQGGLLGGIGKSDTGGGGGFIDTILGGIGAIFGGSRDSGGRGAAGVPVMIGKGAQPEMYVPDSAGSFFPKGSYGGGSVTQNIKVDGPFTRRSARQLALESARSQRIATARLG